MARRNQSVQTVAQFVLPLDTHYRFAKCIVDRVECGRCRRVQVQLLAFALHFVAFFVKLEYQVKLSCLACAAPPPLSPLCRVPSVVVCVCFEACCVIVFY